MYAAGSSSKHLKPAAEHFPYENKQAPRKLPRETCSSVKWAWSGRNEHNDQPEVWQFPSKHQHWTKKDFVIRGFGEQTQGRREENQRMEKSECMNYAADTSLPLSSLQEIMGIIHLLALLWDPSSDNSWPSRSAERYYVFPPRTPMWRILVEEGFGSYFLGKSEWLMDCIERDHTHASLSFGYSTWTQRERERVLSCGASW